MKEFLLRVIILTAVSVLTACGSGGGSSNASRQFEGKLSKTNGAPLSGLQVVIDETGDRAETSAEGTFSIQSSVRTAKVRFFFTGKEIDTQLDLTSIPRKAAFVSFVVHYDEPLSGLRLENVEYRDESGRAIGEL